MSDIVLWLYGSNIVSTIVPKLPVVIVAQDCNYEVVSSLGDYDGLRDQGGKLIGFSFSISGDEKILKSDFVKRAKNVSLIAKEFRVALHDEPPFQSDGIQGATWVYRCGNNFMIGLHKWADWGRLGFSTVSFSKSKSELGENS